MITVGMFSKMTDNNNQTDDEGARLGGTWRRGVDATGVTSSLLLIRFLDIQPEWRIV